MQNQKPPLLIYITIFLLPFFFIYWMIPFISSRTIGNDYLQMLRMQMELLFSLKTGSFPLYVPGFASGHSSAALTLGQIFHPISYIAAILPGYWSGKLIDVNNLIKLLSLSLTHLMLFEFLRRLKLNVLFSFVISLVTVYNLRILDLYRYGPALEAYTEQFFLFMAIAWYWMSPKKVFPGLCIIGATYILVCSGHPQMMYYGLLGAGLFMIIIPFFISDVLQDRNIDNREVCGFWLKAGFCMLLGIMISSAYFLPFYYDFIAVNSDRLNQNFVWANENLDTLIGTANNFFLPLRSEVHSAIGGSSLYLMAVMLPVLIFFKVRIPRSIWAIWALLVIILLYMMGSGTPFYWFAWKYLPLTSSFRIPGRISMIMPVFIMMILAWAVKAEPLQLRIGKKSLQSGPLALLACSAMLLIAAYYLVYIVGHHILSFGIFKKLFPPYPIGHFLNISFFDIEFLIFILGIASLTALTVYGVRKDAYRLLGVLLALLIVVQLGIVLNYRASFWIDNKYESPSFEEMQTQKKKKLDYLYYPGGGMHSSIVNTQLERSFMEPFLGKIFTDVIPVESREDVYRRMKRGRLPQQIFVEGYSREGAETITEVAKNMKEGTVSLIYSSFNRMQFLVNSGAPALFGFSYPYSGYWSAWLNGEKVQVYRANGAAHAVAIPEGESLIEFRYWSNASFWGMLISCAAFTLTGLFVSASALKGFRRITSILIVLLIGAGGFMLWFNSLYTGDNLETEYAWTYISPSDNPNLAYGKKNWLSDSATSAHWNFPHAKWHYQQQDLYVSRFVDGNRSPLSGFSTRPSDSPAWFLDLNDIEKIRQVLLFESGKDPSINARPLQIAISDDGSTWNTVASVVSRIEDDNPTLIVFDKPLTTRYIKIKASGKSQLSFDEVEVYGAQILE